MMSHYLTRLASLLFWLLISLITLFLLMEQSKSTPLFPHVDKVMHATIFAILTAVGYLAHAKHGKWLYFGIIIYGAITEILQGAYTQTRLASIGDWLADVVGVLLCVILINILNQLTHPHVS